MLHFTKNRIIILPWHVESPETSQEEGEEEEVEEGAFVDTEERVHGVMG